MQMQLCNMLVGRFGWLVFSNESLASCVPKIIFISLISLSFNILGVSVLKTSSFIFIAL